MSSQIKHDPSLAIAEAPLTYGIQFPWGQFALTEQAAESYDLQCISLDRKPPEQLKEPRHNPSVWPRVILAAPNEMSFEGRQAAITVKHDSLRTTFWLAHHQPSAEFADSLREHTIKSAMSANYIPDEHKDEYARHITFSDKRIPISNLSARHVAPLQLQMLLRVLEPCLALECSYRQMSQHEAVELSTMKRAGLMALGVMAASETLRAKTSSDNKAMQVAQVLTPGVLLAGVGASLYQRKKTRTTESQIRTAKIRQTYAALARTVCSDIADVYSD